MRTVSALVAAAVVVVLAACDDDAGDGTQFCDEVAENVEGLRVDPATEDEVDDLIDLWRDVGSGAPLAIEEEWDAHTDNLELAWTSDDQQEVVAGAFAAERSTVAIAAWLSDNCGIDFGPVTTIVPGTVATTTTAPGATTTSAG